MHSQPRPALSHLGTDDNDGDGDERRDTKRTHAAAHEQQPPASSRAHTCSTPARLTFPSPFCASFTGFREDDEWHHHDEDKQDRNGADEEGRRSEQDVCEQLAQKAGVTLQATLTSSTRVLVARRGLTKKRLLAALRRMPVVLPQWVADGCPLMAAPTSQSHHNDANGAQPPATSAAGVFSVETTYAVPWLHGYVFSTTGLTTQEKEAIEHICVEQHGAVVEAALTYRCDVLLTSAECVKELQELLRRDSLGSLVSDAKGAARHGTLRTTIDGAAAETGDTRALNSQKARRSGEGAGQAIQHSALDSWLTDKLRFALEFDIPVVDYVKFFSQLRLDRLPAPTIGLTPTCTQKTMSAAADKTAKKGTAAVDAAAGGWSGEVEEALNGSDFDTVVHVCRVVAPAGGASRWRLVLDRVAAAQKSSKTSVEEGTRPVGQEEDAKGSESCNCDRSPRDSAVSAHFSSPSSSSSSCSTSSSSSASTVSDPDAWDDFVQHVLVPTWPETGVQSASREDQQPQRISAYPAEGARRSPAHSPRHLPLNTIDVEVHTTTEAAAKSATLHTTTPDYYSETGASHSAMTALGTNTCQEADSLHPPRNGEDALFGASQVDPSPRLTTNTLQPRQPPPQPSNAGGGSPPCTACSGTSSPEENFGARIAAYYAAQRREQPLSHRMPFAAGLWGSSSRTAEQPPAAGADAARYNLPKAGTGAETLSGDTLPATTQVLVESCVATDEEPSAPARPQQPTAAGPQQCQSSPSFLSRITLPLWTLRPPFLSVSLLGCSATEEQRATLWCGICRFLRSPIPTAETDVVVLGSRVLMRKKLTTFTTTTAARGCLPGGLLKKSGKGGGARSLRATAVAAAPAKSPRRQKSNHADPGEESMVSVHYWEVDAAVVRALTETCGIAISRVAPLRWLEDAATATRKAAAAMATTSMFTGGSLAEEEVEEEISTAPQGTLADVVHECVEAAKAKQARQHEQQPVTHTTDVTPLFNAAFHPLPVLQPEQLPSLADPRYFIRLRRPFTKAVTPGTETSGASVKSSLPTTTCEDAALSATRHNNTAAPKPTPHLTTKLASTSVTAFKVSADSPLTSNHLYNNSKSGHGDGGGTMWQPATSELDVSTHDELASPASTVSASAGAAAVATASAAPQQIKHDKSEKANGGAAKTDLLSHSYDEELATAGRRFHQLLALFRVEDVASLPTEEGDAAADARQKVLRSCSFCCMEGDYARVDWAVLRGLVRYGGGHAEKKSAEAWGQLMERRRGKEYAPVASQVKSVVDAGPSSDEAAGEHCDQRRLAARVRRTIEYERQRCKLIRLMRSVAENGGGRLRGDVVKISLEARGGGGGAAAKTAAHRHNVEGDAMKKLKTKLINTARSCRQSPAFWLLPHSFQRAAIPLTTRQQEFTGGAPIPTSNQAHALRGLPRVTQDYVLACLAVGYCLHPQSCFLFYTAIPSAPDARLFDARSLPAAHPPPRSYNDSDLNHRLTTAATTPQLGKPALSAWMREKRYSKPASVGVCVAFLWGLPPAAHSRWVSTVVASTDVTAILPPSLRLVERTTASSGGANEKRQEKEGVYRVPSALLVPLLRVLLLGFRNAVEAMGGHIADTFSPASVTHVVVVDVGAILARTVQDLFAADTGNVPDRHASDSTWKEVANSEEAGEGTTDRDWLAASYWPRDDLSDIVRCAARQELSLVNEGWLASCVEWGTFIDESSFFPPHDLHERIVQQQQHMRQQCAQKGIRLQRPPYSPRQPQKASVRQRVTLTPQGIRDGSAARTAEERKRQRTPSPTLSSSLLPTAVVAPDASCATASAHTPPRPWSSTTREGDDDNRGQPRPLHGTSMPSRSFTSASPLHCEEEEEASRYGSGVAGRMDDCLHNAPVMHRLLPQSSASNSNSNADLYTPPPRPPLPLHSPMGFPCHSHHQPHAQPGRHTGFHSVDDTQQPSPQPHGRSGSNATPPPPPTSAAATSRWRSSLSSSAERHRGSLSASQHNTYSLATQQDTEAYVEQLSSVFNFCSPGSTPLPSSARRGRQLSVAVECEGERTPLHSTFGAELLREVLNCSSPTRPRATSRAMTLEDVQQGTVTPPLATQQPPRQVSQRGSSLSGVASTPRRRTLRTLAAAAAVSTHTPFSSPDLRRRRVDSDSPPSSSSVPALQLLNESPATNTPHRGEKSVAAVTTVDHTRSGQEVGSAVLVVLGDSSGSTLLSRRGTEGRNAAVPQVSSISFSNDENKNAIDKAMETGAPPPNPVELSGSKSEEEEGDVWVTCTPSSSPEGQAASDDGAPFFPASRSAASGDVLCRFSGGADIAEGEATVPLPCPVVPSTVAVAAEVSGECGVPDASYMDDIIPDSQPMELWDAEVEEDNGVLVPASFIAATEGGVYEAHAHEVAEARLSDEGETEKSCMGTEAEAEAAGRGGAQRSQSWDLIGAEKVVAHANFHEGGEDCDDISPQPQRQQKQEGQRTGIASISAAPPTTRESNCEKPTANRDSRPRLGACSVPRQPSPPPVPPLSSPPARQTVVCVDVSSGTDEEVEKTRQAEVSNSSMRCNENSAAAPLTPSTTSPAPTTSPWVTHQPLSLSRRVSRSPVPPPQRQSTRPKNNSHAKNVVAAGAASALCGRHGAVLHCLRVYVLHDLPHREARVRRCCDALQQFVQERHSPTTPTLAIADHCEGSQTTSKDLSGVHGVVHRTDHLQQAASPRTCAEALLPVCFVPRCEDADVCVTHEVNLRESVLVAIVRGCFVVQPGFLECVAAVLEGFCRHCGCDGNAAAAGGEAEMHSLPHPHAPSSLSSSSSDPSTAVALCYQRLCAMCVTYEWTAATALATTTAAASSSPMYRSLVLQCRRQRQAAQARLRAKGGLRCNSGGCADGLGSTVVRHAVGADGRASFFFSHHSFLLLYSAALHASSTGNAGADVPVAKAVRARVRSIQRLLVAGGGDVLSLVNVGCRRASTSTVREEEGEPRQEPTGCTSTAQPIERSLLCCCRYCPGDHNVDDYTCAATVTDKAVYHDLLHLLCDTISRHCRSTDGAVVAMSAEDRIHGNVHSPQQRRCPLKVLPQPPPVKNVNAIAPLVVLLDTSLSTTADTKNAAEAACTVTLTQNHRGATGVAVADGHVQSVLQRSKRNRESDDKHGSSTRATNEADETPQCNSCSFIRWLSEWLPQYDYDDEASRDEVSCYTRTAGQALRSHLSACCSFARQFHELSSSSSSSRISAANTAKAVGNNSAIPCGTSLSLLAERRWSYRVDDLPFRAPTLEEVFSVLVCDAAQACGTWPSLDEISNAWGEHEMSNAYRVEFRSTSWVGACVAAGGSALMTDDVSISQVSPGDSANATSVNAWVGECDAQTLFAVLPYAWQREIVRRL
jgi:hypothetical protein